MTVRIGTSPKSNAQSAPFNDAEICIRRVRPGDGAALRSFYANLSPESRHARFLGLGAGLTEDEARSFCTPDHMHEEGFVAVSLAASPADCVVGHLCLEPAARDQVEMAVAVADGYQGHGIGRRLFEAALEWARARGLKKLVASCFVGNSRVLRLLSSSPYGASIAASSGGVVDVSIPLERPLPQSFTSAAVPRAKQRRRSAGVPVRRPIRAVWCRGSSETAGAVKRAPRNAP